MENLDADQLPEVDSLPDGFVDSSTDPLAPQTPDLGQEKMHNDCKEDKIKAELTNNEAQPVQNGNEVECPDAMPGSATLVSESPIAISEHTNEQEHVQGNCQSTGRSIQGDMDTQTRDAKVLPSSATSELQKSSKVESCDAKRKNMKKALKSEKELLEFMFKYQQVLSERDAAIGVRDKLESLCRELQRQNKLLMDECKRMSTEGQNLRLDLSTKCQDALKDVSIKLEEQKEESLSQLKENEMLRSKLKQFADQYTLLEQQHAQKLKQKTLELQLAELKIKQHEEKLAQGQSQMKIYAEQVPQLLATEKNLRLQLTADGEKFQQFQDVLSTFKQEIEKMAKSIMELKKENMFLKSKCEKSDVTLIELVEEREKLKKQLEKTKNQKEKLESLCRSLQAERKQSGTTNNVIETAPKDES
ncbi:hypothetical protein K2173_011673 [Erythroxylum novogranatense]|uniref:Alpha-taxilin n=1 Tax=Erythroxylum novogranatense TaxID=1862640 RepID=A0AAV8T1I8_9ROSI|nr:hypothetical protein K2173_011673 [Erythroxylum novogranatense]